MKPTATQLAVPLHLFTPALALALAGVCAAGCGGTSSSTGTITSLGTPGIACPAAGSTQKFQIAGPTGTSYSAFVQSMAGSEMSTVTLSLSASGTGCDNNVFGLGLQVYSDAYVTKVGTMTGTVNNASTFALQTATSTPVTFSSGIPFLVTQTLAFQVLINSSAGPSCAVAADAQPISAVCLLSVNSSSAAPLLQNLGWTYAATIVAQ